MIKTPKGRPKPLFDYREHELTFERGTDAAGAWFAVAVLLAFAAAGLIVYRTGGEDFRTASNDKPVVARAALVNPAQPSH